MLTPKNDEIHYEARKLKKAKKVYSAYTCRGQVYVKSRHISEGVLIRELKELEKISTKLADRNPSLTPTYPLQIPARSRYSQHAP